MREENKVLLRICSVDTIYVCNLQLTWAKRVKCAIVPSIIVAPQCTTTFKSNINYIWCRVSLENGLTSFECLTLRVTPILDLLIHNFEFVDRVNRF